MDRIISNYLDLDFQLTVPHELAARQLLRQVPQVPQQHLSRPEMTVAHERMFAKQEYVHQQQVKYQQQNNELIAFREFCDKRHEVNFGQMLHENSVLTMLGIEQVGRFNNYSNDPLINELKAMRAASGYQIMSLVMKNHDVLATYNNLNREYQQCFGPRVKPEINQLRRYLGSITLQNERHSDLAALLRAKQRLRCCRDTYTELKQINAILQNKKATADQIQKITTESPQLASMPYYKQLVKPMITQFMLEVNQAEQQRVIGQITSTLRQAVQNPDIQFSYQHYGIVKRGFLSQLQECIQQTIEQGIAPYSECLERQFRVIDDALFTQVPNISLQNAESLAELQHILAEYFIGYIIQNTRNTVCLDHSLFSTQFGQQWKPEQVRALEDKIFQQQVDELCQRREFLLSYKHNSQHGDEAQQDAKLYTVSYDATKIILHDQFRPTNAQVVFLPDCYRDQMSSVNLSQNNATILHTVLNIDVQLLDNGQIILDGKYSPSQSCIRIALALVERINYINGQKVYTERQQVRSLTYRLMDFSILALFSNSVRRLLESDNSDAKKNAVAVADLCFLNDIIADKVMAGVNNKVVITQCKNYLALFQRLADDLLAHTAAGYQAYLEQQNTQIAGNKELRRFKDGHCTLLVRQILEQDLIMLMKVLDILRKVVALSSITDPMGARLRDRLIAAAEDLQSQMTLRGARYGQYARDGVHDFIKYVSDHHSDLFTKEELDRLRHLTI